MNSKMTRMAGVVLVVAMLATTAVASLAYAASPTEEPGNLPPVGETGTAPSGPPVPQGDGSENVLTGRFAQRDLLMSQDDTNAAMAEALGMTVDELQEALQDQTIAEIAKEKNVHMADIELALQAARQGILQTAVEDGTLTQKQADLLAEKLGDMPTQSNRYERMFDDGKLSLDTALTIAQTLGMTVEDLKAALAQKTFFEIAKEQDVAIADVENALRKDARSARTAAVEETLQRAVEDGRLTQEQAELLGALFALRGEQFDSGFPGTGMLGNDERLDMQDFGSRGMAGGPGDRSERVQHGPRDMAGGPRSDQSSILPDFGPREMAGGPRNDQSERAQHGPREMAGGPGGDKAERSQAGPRGMTGGPGGKSGRMQDFGPREMAGGPGGRSERAQHGPRDMRGGPRNDQSERAQHGPREMAGGPGGRSERAQHGPREMAGGPRNDQSGRMQDFGPRDMAGGPGDKSERAQHGPREMAGGPGEQPNMQGFDARGSAGQPASESGTSGTSRGQMQPAWPFFGTRSETSQ